MMPLVLTQLMLPMKLEVDPEPSGENFERCLP